MKVIFGGSFDPVHIGHLRIATELAQLIDSTVHLMPCQQAVHKSAQGASAEDRLAMLELAVRENTYLEIDQRELARQGQSYTITSLKELRVEAGEDVPVIFVMGSDSAETLASWKSSGEFAGLANFLVLTRPGQSDEAQLSVYKTRLESLGLVHAESLEQLTLVASGLFFELSLSELDVSSSHIRECIQQKHSIRYIVPDAVERYICDNALYV